jgi:hypothetical protein
MPARPVTGIINANAWAFHNPVRGVSVSDEEIVAQQIVTIEMPVDLHRLAEQARAGSLAGEAADRL